MLDDIIKNSRLIAEISEVNPSAHRQWLLHAPNTADVVLAALKDRSQPLPPSCVILWATLLELRELDVIEGLKISLYPAELKIHHSFPLYGAKEDIGTREVWDVRLLSRGLSDHDGYVSSAELASHWLPQIRAIDQSATLRSVSPNKLRLSLMDAGAVIRWLANRDEVHWISPAALTASPLNNGAREITQTGGALFGSEAQTTAEACSQVFIGLQSLGLDGQGEIVSVGDTGLDTDSCFFFDEFTNISFFRDARNATLSNAHRKVAGYWALVDGLDATDGHGTHVSGSVAGFFEGPAQCDEPGLALYNGIPNTILLHLVYFHFDELRNGSKSKAPFWRHAVQQSGWLQVRRG